MSWRIPDLDPIPSRFQPRLRYVAELHGVSVERLVETIRKRRKFARARKSRERSRRRHLEKNPTARKGLLLQAQATYAGEGELHAFLEQLGWTQREFAEYAGIHPSAFTRWRGHPLARWPVELLRLRIENQRMREVLQKHTNLNPDQFSPTPPPPMPTGRYPRKLGDVRINGKSLAEYSPWKR